ncbi:3-hydroxyacyl-CoA dehydrogenase [Cryobacterium frigoriphilum]|uniref:3-hydroxyacyl-CoA dehydrogenase n=1 Tax=Cryobacterium frigoriphilum TaxID=1259150 RepID=A0A4R8ZYT5_9MICO|nr:3-hydroxyacyl-CoA dehydrogenase [Cryobacterium frigoriphilum]
MRSERPAPFSLRPDPEPLLINLARGYLETMAGAREPEQLARWLSDGAYRRLLKRVVLASRARAVTKRAAVMPTIIVDRVIVTEPNEGVIEAVVILHSRVRTRAVAVRLEGRGDRWRASAINVM